MCSFTSHARVQVLLQIVRGPSSGPSLVHALLQIVRHSSSSPLLVHAILQIVRSSSSSPSLVHPLLKKQPSTQSPRRNFQVSGGPGSFLLLFSLRRSDRILDGICDGLLLYRLRRSLNRSIRILDGICDGLLLVHRLCEVHSSSCSECFQPRRAPRPARARPHFP